MNSQNPISKDQLLEMYEGREDKIPQNRIPPDLEDFPVDIQKAILCFGKFQDRLVPDIGYTGKDFSLFHLIADLEHVEDRSLFLEGLLQLDSFYIEKNNKDMEAARKTK